MLQTTIRALPVALLVALLLPTLWRGWGAVQGNHAFVTLNRLPSPFTTDIDPAILARTETQLLAALHYQPERASTWRMVAVVRRAQGANTPAGLTARDLLVWGQQKEQGGDLEAARYLYQWATDIEAELGDAWYGLGNVYQAQETWAAAYQAYERASLALTWQDVATRAAAHYQLGELLLWREGDPAAAVSHYRAALAIRPADHWARLRLGYALYWSGAGVAAAEREILVAIAQWPDEKYRQWPYFYLGEMYENAGLPLKAIAAYEQVIALDPADDRVQARLALLRSR